MEKQYIVQKQRETNVSKDYESMKKEKKWLETQFDFLNSKTKGL